MKCFEIKCFQLFIQWVILISTVLIAFPLSGQTMFVNEIMFKPGPNTTGCDQKLVDPANPTCGREYIELYNSNCNQDYDISGYVLASANNTGSLGNAGAFCFPPGTVVPAGSFLIVGGGNDNNAANGTYNYPAGSFDIKIPNYVGTQYLCLNTQGTFWFLSNIDGWMALYEPNGTVHSAVYWSSNPNNINTVADFNLSPCSPSAYTGPTLKSAKQIYSTTPSLIQYMGNSSNVTTGNTISRMPDGGTFQINRPKTIGPNRSDRCNDGQCLACGNLILTPTDATCGQANGSIVALVSDTATSPCPYSYQVTGPVSQNITTCTNPYTFNNLPPGNYTIQVTDNFTPPNVTTRQTTVGNSGSISATATSSSASCGQSNGSATVSVSSGPGNYTYIWSTSPQQNSAVATNIPSGNYTVTVISGSCSTNVSVSVSEIGGPSIISITSSDATCGANNGSATVTAGGGSGNYTYAWSTTPQQTNATASNIPTGNYTVTVSSGTCSVTGTVSVGNQGGPSIQSITSTDAVCGQSNGSVSVTVSGGSGSYTYLWNTTPQQNTSTVSNLPPGNYSVTVSDGGTCPVNSSVIVGNVGAPSVSLISSTAHCSQSDGSLTAVVTGGSGNFSFIWNTNPQQHTSVANGIPSGNYSVTVTDIDNNCQSFATGFVNDAEGPSASFIPSKTTTAPGDEIEFTYTGSQPIQVFNWNFGDGSQEDLTSAPTHIFQNSGSYNVILLIEDKDGCTDSASTVISIVNLQIPNVITPNGDGFNDKFIIRGIEPLNTKKLTIYNRWGNIIFETYSYNNDWDGDGAADGVYFYIFDAPELNQSFQGNLTILKQ